MKFLLERREQVEEVELRRLERSTAVLVWTWNTRYRLVLQEGSDVLLQGGALFPEPTPAHFVGARAGGYLIKSGAIGVGLMMEFRVGDQRFVTSPVVAIATESPDTTALG